MNEKSWRDILPPIFADCVHTEDGRYKMSAPFVSGEYVSATDGRICVRMPKAGIDLSVIPPCEKAPPLDGLAWNKEYGLPLPVPEIEPEPELEDCETCNGTGQHWCGDCEAEHDCGQCDATGKKDVVYKPIDCGGPTPLGSGYVRKLFKHGAKLYPPVGGDQFRPWRFTIGNNIEGLLMPMRKEPA